METQRLYSIVKEFDSFSKCIPLLRGEDDTHIRDKSFGWLKRRYEVFVENNGVRIRKAEEYLKSKNLSV